MGDTNKDLVQLGEVAEREMRGLVDERTARSIFDWIASANGGTPAEIMAMADNATSKMSWSLVYLMITSLNRINVMQNYVEAANSRIYDPQTVLTDDAEVVRSKKNEAFKELMSTMEYVRKFLVQNKDALKQIPTEVDVLRDELLRMNPKDLEKLSKIVKSNKLDEVLKNI